MTKSIYIYHFFGLYPNNCVYIALLISDLPIAWQIFRVAIVAFILFLYIKKLIAMAADTDSPSLQYNKVGPCYISSKISELIESKSIAIVAFSL